MRISTVLSFQMNADALLTKQATLNHLQQQLATGRRIVTPADDPIGAAHALQTSQALAVAQNRIDNIHAAIFKVKQESNVLDAVTAVLQNARNVAIAAQGNPSMTERTDYAAYLRELYQDLLAYANATDANGDYMFAGSLGGTQPFQQTSGPSNYQGNSVQQRLMIGNDRSIPVSDPGNTVFGVGTPNDPFAVIDQFINDLLNPLLTGAAYDAAVATALSRLGMAVERVKGVHNQVSNRMQELQVALDTETNFRLQYQNELDRVESVDMQKLAVQLQLQQVSLQASQQAFVKASQLSLFNLL
ncbi:MAG: flagellar hook-associated protein FlgL [Methylophilaceae bacterium]|nr:flagellar hook-associated protein FlgL [Methylophilaceae bacterium]